MRTAATTTVVLIAALGLAPRAAHGTAPGQNGLIAFQSNRGGNDDIYVMNPDGTGVQRLTTDPRGEAQPAWSPDGTRIAFRRGDNDRDREIWVMSADGSGQMQLTDNEAEDEEPSWSPDGAQIVFESDRDGEKGLYVMNADGSDPVLITPDINAANRDPAWSSDGSLIAFRRQPGDGDTREIWIIDPDGGDPVRLTNNSAEDENPAWSPDGATIVFESDRDGGKEIYAMGADGSNPTRLTFREDDENNTPTFSPDGTKIAFRGVGDDDADVFVMNADGSGLVAITGAGGDDGNPSWQPLPLVTSTTTPVGTTTTTTMPGTQLVSGKTLLLKDNPSNPDKRRLKLLIKDKSISIGAGNDSADDPTLHGGELYVVSRSGDGFATRYELLADRWAYKGKVGKNKGYKLKNAGPIATVLVKSGKLIKVIGKGAALGHSLASDPAPVHVALSIGGHTFCATFGGRASYTNGKKYSAKKAAGPEDCAALAPICGDGIAEPGEACPLLEGPPDELALDAVFDYFAAPPVTEGERDVDAAGVPLVRTRIEIAFVETATVGAVNTLLESVEGTIIGMLDGLASLVVLIPDPGSTAALDDLVAQVERDPVVRGVLRALEAEPGLLPDNHAARTRLSRIDHNLAIGAAAAWNARAARRGDVPVTIIDWFGNRAPDGTLVDVSGLPGGDFGNVGLGADGSHGYHVLGIVAGTFGGATSGTGYVTGMVPGTVPMRVVDRRVLDGLSADIRAVQIAKNAPGNSILSTSIIWGCGVADFIKQSSARGWIEKVRAAGIEHRMLHLTCAGNRKAGCFDDFLAEEGGSYAAAALLPLTTLLGNPVANLTNTLVIENARNTAGPAFAPRCLAKGSKYRGHLAGIGSSVWSLTDRSGSAGNKSGCSMATPQVAGLAAYLWSIDPSMTLPQIMGLLGDTASTLTGTTGPTDCSEADPAPIVDAYAAVLALDAAATPTVTSAPVRHAILDVDDDGDFDEVDLVDWTLTLIDPTNGLINEPSEPEYERYDLNGDGYSGGASRRAAFDLDRVGSIQYGTSQYDRITQDVEGSPAYFDENALTDLGILCYYAYSDLYVGTDQRRRELLGYERCAPLILDVTFPDEIRDGVPEILQVTVGRESAAGSEPVADVYIELLATGGTTMPMDGLTNAQGEFSSEVSLDATSGRVEVVVRARESAGGRILGEKTVRATAPCTDAPTHVTLDVGNGEPDPEIDGALLRTGTEYRVTVSGTVSIWTSEWDSGACKGAPAAGNSGPTGLDAHYWFAIPVGSSLCSDSFSCCPNDTGKFQVNTGSGFDHPTATPDTYQASHRYEHLVTGEGQPISFRWQESNARGDDYGIFEITVACGDSPVTTTTTSTSTSTTSTTSTSTSTPASTVVTTTPPTTSTTTSTLPGGGGVFYRGYDATGFTGPTVDVAEAIQTEQVMLGSASILLAPVSYLGSAVPQADAHLACWTDPGTTFSGTADVTNIFGLQSISVGDPAHLCVPVDGTLAAVDNYRCYSATGTSVNVNAFLSDAFVSESADVSDPVTVCLPAEVDGSGVVAPLSYLVCYATMTTATAVGTVPVSTALGTGDFDVVTPLSVCVPSIVQSITPTP